MIRTLVALAALATALPAFAQNSGWYIGGGAASVQAEFVRSDFTGLASGTYSVDDNDVAPRVFGGFRMAPNWAVEFSVASLGRHRHRFSDTGGSAVYHYDASAATVAIAARLPLARGVALNGRLGAAFTAAQIRLAAVTGTITTNPPLCAVFVFDDCTATQTNVYWGLGAQFDVSPRWGIRLDYDNYGEVGAQFETGRGEFESWSVNVVFRF